ncbi:MAG: sialidase family protein, partial [Luminiphilus sp.]
MQPEHRSSLKSSCSRFLTVAAAMLFIVGATAPNAAESVSASAMDRRAQAPAVAVTEDGTVHAIWFDKGAVGQADRKGAHVGGGRHSHQAFADLRYARWVPGEAGFSESIRINPEPGQVWGFSISRPVIAADGEGRIHIVYPGNGTSPKTGKSVASSLYSRSIDGGQQFEEPI